MGRARSERASEAGGVDTENDLSVQVGDLELDAYDDGEGPVERFFEGGVGSILELGNLPMWAGLAETGLEIGQNGTMMTLDGHGSAVVNTGVHYGGQILNAMYHQAMENPFTFAGEMVGELLAAKGLGRVGSAARASKRAGSGKAAGRVDRSEGVRSSPDASGKQTREVAADGGGDIGALKRAVAESDSDLDPEEIDSDNYNKVAEQIDPKAADADTEALRDQFDNISPGLTDLPGVSRNDINWIENQMAQHDTDLYDGFRELQHDLRRLATADDGNEIENLGEMVKNATGNDYRGLKGLVGQTSIGKNLLDEGIDPSALVFEKGISGDDIPKIHTKSPKYKNVDISDSDIDVDTATRIEVNGQALESPAIESKNTNYHLEDRLENWNSEFIAQKALAGDLVGLWKKLNTFTASGEQQIIVVTKRPDAKFNFDDEIRNAFLPQELQNIESLGDLAAKVKSRNENTQIVFASYDDVGE